MEQREQQEDADRSFMTVWHYEGRDIPIEVIGPPVDEDDRFAEAVAEFLWKLRDRASPQT